MIGYYLRLDEADLALLKNLTSGPVAHHIRTAIKDYLQKIKNAGVSASASASKQEGGKNNG